MTSTLTTPRQLTLDLSISAMRPLVPLEAVMVLADKDEDDVLSLIETGSLAWAWDIRSAMAERREIRVWRESLLEYLSTGTNRMSSACTTITVYTRVLPHHRDDVRSTELQRMFSASQSHIQTLINEGLLPDAYPHAGRPMSGPNSFSRVKAVAVIAFLQDRRVA